MHKEQQDDNNTKEIRIIRDIGIWKIINHEGRTLDATRTGPKQRKVWPYSTVSRVPRALAMNAAEAQLEVASCSHILLIVARCGLAK